MIILIFLETVYKFWKFGYLDKPTFKALDTFGSCQRPVFSLCVSQHNASNKKTCENLNSFGRRSCKRIMEDAWFRWGLEIISNILVRNYFSQKTALLQRGHFVDNVLSYQHFPIARCKCLCLQSFCYRKITEKCPVPLKIASA